MPKKLKSHPTKENKMVTHQQIQHYSGIIPHPNIIEGYERNCPGATDRILAMTENELKNKQDLDRLNQENLNDCRLKMLETELSNSKRGQLLGFILLLIMIVGGFFLVYIGRSLGGYTSIVSSVLITICSVLYNKNK